MGNFLKTIPLEQVQRPQRAFFSKFTLSKLRQYHGVFKSLCDTFSIDDSQFCQIFGSPQNPTANNSHLQPIFSLLDDDNNLLIDGLQLFCGLILFSQAPCPDKVCFLFDIFDFNDFNSLSTTDVQFLFLNCCSAVHKILGLRSPLPEAEIRDLVAEQFPNRRVNISEMVRWAAETDYARRLLMAIGRGVPVQEGLFGAKVYAGRNTSIGSGLESEVYRKSKARQDRKLEQWILSLSKKLKTQTDRNHQQVNLQLQWAYGIRCLDIKQSLQYHCLCTKELLIYPTACLVVLSYLKMNKQLHYSKHQHQVISLSKTPNRRNPKNQLLIASGQLAPIPKIHLWSAPTLQTLFILESSHKVGISLLQFSPDGSTLVSVGLQKQSPLLVHSMQSFKPKPKLLYSTCMDWPMVEIAVVRDYTAEGVQQEMILCTTRQVMCLRRGAGVVGLAHWQEKLASDATCCAALKYSKHNRYLRSHQEPGSSACAIITGHEKGQLMLWEHPVQGEYMGNVLKTYPAQLVKIQAGPQTIIVGSFCSYIDLWSIEFKLLRTIDLTALGVKFMSYETVNLVGVPDGIIVLTKEGDLVRLKTNGDRDRPAKPTRILNVVKNRGRQKCACLLETGSQTTIYTSGVKGIIYGLNVRTHEMVDVWNLGESITALDVVPSTKGGSILAAGTLQGRIYLRIDFQQIQKNYQTSKTINDIKLLNSGSTVIAACQDRYIYILSCPSSCPFSNSRKIDLDSSIPKSIQLIEGKLLVSTAERKLYLLSLSDYKYKLLDDKSKQQLTKPIAVKYQYAEGRELPVVISGKVLVMGSTAGGLCFSRNSWSLVNRVNGHIGHHAGMVNEILVSGDLGRVYTVGDDCTVMCYRLRFINQSQLLKTPQTICKLSYTYDEVIQREINYCIYGNNTLTLDHDQHLLVRGIRNPTLAKLLRGVMDDWKQPTVPNPTSSSSTKKQPCSLPTPTRHPPPVNLTLDYVYGIQTFERRDCLLYVTEPKRFIYYVSRIVVLYNPQSNQQQFYTAHRAKVTCLCVLDGRLAASGEAAFDPCVYVWNYDTLRTVRVVKTGHQWGITHLAGQGDVLLTVGVEEKYQGEDKLEERENLTFSVQLSSVSTGRALCFRKQPAHPVYSICFDPFDSTRFITVGEGSVTFWHSDSLSIVKQSICFTDEQTVTACTTYQYLVSGKDCFDVVVGTRSGKLAVVSQRKHFLIMRDKAHAKWINVVRWAVGKEEVFVTAAEDETLKVWNKRFQCLYEQETRKIDFFKEITKMNSQNKYFQKASFQRNLSIQSICICPNNPNPTSLTLLLSTRNGQLMQLTLSDNHTQSKYSLYLRNHCSQSTQNHPHKRVFFALHPRFDILLSLGEDQNLFVWDTEKNKLISSKILGYVAYPTAVRFNRDGDILVVGFSDGLVIFLDSKIIKSNQGKNDEKFIVPTLSLIQKYKQERRAAVLSIEFSDSGEHLAVSFNNSSSAKSKYDPTTSGETSFISLFINRSKDKSKALSKSQQSDKLYTWFTDVRCQQGEKIYETVHNNIYGMACYFMSFAEAEGKTYLLIYYQLVDSNNIRLNHMTESDYIVWDVNTSTIVVNLDLISHIPWRRLNFPNSINSQYQLYTDLCQPGTQLLPCGQPAPRNNNILKPQICSMWAVKDQQNRDSFLLLGSLNGDIHLVQTRSLQYSQSFSHSPNESEMYLGRTYSAHTSFVDHMEATAASSALYTAGVEDQCLMKWRLNYEQEVPHAEEGRDIFGEVPVRALFQGNLERYRQRELGGDMREGVKVAGGVGAAGIMSMHFVIGRRASSLRNSLFFDCQNNAVYTCGRNILRLSLTNLKQTVLYEQSDAGQSQIGCICMTLDRRIVAVGTNSTRATLILWQVSSKTCLKTMRFSQLVSIILLQFADDGSHILLYGLQVDGTGRLHLIDSTSQTVLGTVRMKYDIAWLIKGFSFLTDTFEEFVTCGVNHLRLWTYRGGELTYENIALRDDKQQPKRYVVLFTVIAVGGFGYLTCCDSGYLYLLSPSHKVVSKVKGHEGLCLALAKEGKLQLASSSSIGHTEQIRVVSGGKDGRIVLWKIQNQRLIQVLAYDLSTTINPLPLSQSKLCLYRQIQSVSLSSNSVLVGTRNGSMYQLQLDTLKNQQQICSIRPILHLHDFEPCCGMFFSDNHLYESTRSGLLSIWDVQLNKCLAFEDFDRVVTDLIPCTRTNIYFVVMELEVVALRVGDFKFEVLENFSTSFPCRITAAAITHNEKMLAVSVDRSAESKARVLVYDISGSSFKQLYSTFLPQNPEYLDFSSNNRVLLCKNPDKDVQIDTSLWSQEPLTQKHRWTSHGLKDDSRVSDILKLYSSQKANKILRVLEFSQSNYLFTDTIGTLRVFRKTPNQPPQLVQVSKQHLNSIHCCAKSNKYIATASECDRSIIVWRWL